MVAYIKEGKIVLLLPVLLLIQIYLLVGVKGLDCGDILCSHVHDPVCGFSKASDGSEALNKFHNICHLKKARCLLKPHVDLHQVEDVLCDIKPRLRPSRRNTDFSIIGAHQVCNHTCPTYCVDTHEPACAQIWKSESSSTLKPMINHCHIDMFSCVMGVNVTILPLNSCYKNPSGLLFMTQIAGMKSLGLIQQEYAISEKSISNLGPSSYFGRHRRFNNRRQRDSNKILQSGLALKSYENQGPGDRLNKDYKNILWYDTFSNSYRRKHPHYVPY